MVEQQATLLTYNDTLTGSLDPIVQSQAALIPHQLDQMTGDNVLSYHITSREAGVHMIESGDGILATRGGRMQTQMSPPWCGLEAGAFNAFVETNTTQTACAAVNLS